LRRKGDLVADRADVLLYVYGWARQDPSFLQYFPTLGRLDRLF